MSGIPKSLVLCLAAGLAIGSAASGCREGSAFDPARCGSSPAGCDLDGDGHPTSATGGDDCNDGDASAYPGAFETPYDDIDQDCDGVDLDDVDGDGQAASSAGGPDCDDASPEVHADAFDTIGDGIDSDCDTLQDIITLSAGNGATGLAGDGGPATEASLYEPRGLVLDGQGNLYIADRGHYRVRRVSPDGFITTFAGTGASGSHGDKGPASEAELTQPTALAIDGKGRIYIADGYGCRIRRVDTAGIITTAVGNGDCENDGDGGPATRASLHVPMGIAVDAGGNLFITDVVDHLARWVDSSDVIHPLAGTGEAGYGGDGGPATEARLNEPNGVSVGPDGSIYIADTGNNRIRRIDPQRTMHTVAGTGAEGDEGNGGPALEAEFFRPYDVAVDIRGALYIADTSNHWIRRVNAAGEVGLAAGLDSLGSRVGYDGDGGPATEAMLNLPSSLMISSSGVLYIADTYNSRVRVVNP